jgi:hypothetical protein
MALPRRHPRKCLPVALVVAAVAVAIESQDIDARSVKPHFLCNYSFSLPRLAFATPSSLPRARTHIFRANLQTVDHALRRCAPRRFKVIASIGW